MNKTALVSILQETFPSIQGIYAFGSVTQGYANADSDLDLAILVPGYADPIALWETSGKLANIVGTHVDLLDFRASSTVMQNQILQQGQRWWAKDWQVDAIEAAFLNEMLELNQSRASLLADIQNEGRVYG